MKASQLKSSKNMLIRRMADLLGVAEETVSRMSKSDATFPDPLDRAMSESSRTIELKKRDRERKLIQKIKNALKKIDDGTYGICENCDGQISEDRLKVRPEATMCIECKEEEEDQEKKFGG